MNYRIIYDDLIERVRVRIAPAVSEQHHVLPRCLGGTDDQNNLVHLTPEEHYVAHQLLVKLYDDPRLVFAANMMTVNGMGQHRSSNKRYGWLRRRYIKACKARIGAQNSSFGSSWYHNNDLRQSAKFNEDAVPPGWIKGRKLNWTEKPKKQSKREQSRIERELKALTALQDSNSYSDAIRKLGFQTRGGNYSFFKQVAAKYGLTEKFTHPHIKNNPS